VMMVRLFMPVSSIAAIIIKGHQKRNNDFRPQCRVDFKGTARLN